MAKRPYIIGKSTGNTGTITISGSLATRHGFLIYGGFNGSAGIGAIDREASSMGSAYLYYLNSETPTYKKLTVSLSNNVITVSGLPTWSIVSIISIEPLS